MNETDDEDNDVDDENNEFALIHCVFAGCVCEPDKAGTKPTSRL